MPARLKDVAARAGVSVKTVSNVVNDHPNISAATRVRVQEALTALHYRPNVSARQLKYGKAGFLALAVPQLDSPYFAGLAAQVCADAADLGQIVLLDATRAERSAEQMVLDGMHTHVIDGVIFSPLALDAAEIAARSDGLQMVLLGERAVPPGYDHVAVDSVGAAAAMVAHLAGRGRTRIAAIGRESAQGTASVRLQGFADGLATAGLPLDPSLVLGVPRYERADGYAAMQRLLDRPDRPDAVFCFNDLLAVGALRACAEAGVDVPGEIAVAGFDDIAESAYTNPTLTTITPDLAVLSREALRLVLARRTDPDRPAERVSVPWRLTVRAST